MDLEQLNKRVDWLDDERRKDKLTIATLEERLVNVEANIPPLSQQIKEMSTEIARLSAQLSRFDQIESTILQIRVDTSRSLEAIEKTRAEKEREADKQRRAEQEVVSRSIGEIRKGLEPIPELKKSIQTRVEEDFRLGRQIEELSAKIVEGRRFDEEYRRSIRLIDESHKADSKRVTDIQGEVAALRKRLDEQRGRVELSADSVRKMELRLGEFQGAEGERRQAQTSFLEKQTMWQLERDREWKEVQSRFTDITSQAVALDAQLQALDATQRAVKRSQEAFDEITTRFERRVNEITEMQRLVEDRFRQEWVAYKADDQKRWTNYTLGNEEQQREFSRQFEKFSERLVPLEDMTMEVRDRLQQMTEETQQRLQSLVTVAHQWMEDYERIFGRSVS
jgi:chromosome segregation ATPase